MAIPRYSLALSPPLSLFLPLTTHLSRKGSFIRGTGRAIDPRGNAAEESEISFRINITNSISRRVPMDQDSHRRWRPRKMYGWHQHMHERRAAAVNVGRPLSIAFWLRCGCCSPVVRSLARRDAGRESEVKKKKKRRKKKKGKEERDRRDSRRCCPRGSVGRDVITCAIRNGCRCYDTYRWPRYVSIYLTSRLIGRKVSSLPRLIFSACLAWICHRDALLLRLVIFDLTTGIVDRDYLRDLQTIWSFIGPSSRSEWSFAHVSSEIATINAWMHAWCCEPKAAKGLAPF